MRYLFISLLSLLLLSGCGSKSGKEAGADSTATVSAVAEEKAAPAAVADSTLTGGMPTVLDFWAEWCGPCRKMKPVFESLEKKYEGKVSFKAVNVDEDQNLPMKFGVEAIPTFVFLDAKGNEINRIVGMATEEQLSEALNSIAE